MKNKNNKFPNNIKKIEADDFLLIPLLYSFNTNVNNFRSKNIIKYVKIIHPSEFEKTNTLFALKCNDKSLEPEIMLDTTIVIHPQKSAKLGDYVLVEGPFSTIIGKIIMQKDTNIIGIKNNETEWYPGKNTNLEIYGKVISVMKDF